MNRKQLENLEAHLAKKIRDVLPTRESKQGDRDEKWFKHLVQGNGPVTGNFTVLKVFIRPDVVGEGMPYVVDATRMEKYLGLTSQELRAILPLDAIDADEGVSGWRQRARDKTREATGLKGYFTTTEQIDTFIDGLKRAKQKNQD